MNRPASPILHDYKPSARLKVKKFNALHWFAVGLGLPLLGIALLLTLKNASGNSTTVITEDPAAVIAESDSDLPVALVEESPVASREDFLRKAESR